MPKVKKPAISRIIITLIVLIAFGVTAAFTINAIQAARKEAAMNSETPTFQTILPRNTAIDDLGGWKKLTPPNNDPFFVFVDEIDGVLVNVSQQPLPKDFNSNLETNVANVAKGYNATDTLEAGDTKIYIGNSAKGPQSIIFTKKQLLMLIVSQGKIQDSSWISYVDSLQ